MKAFKRAILYARPNRATKEIGESLHRLLAFLNTQHVDVYQEEDMAPYFDLDIPAISCKKLGERGDLIIVVGGDGSLLSAARLAVAVNTPIIGINKGRLGFLTDILPQDLESHLGAVLAGEYDEEKRFLLQANINDQEELVFEGTALNDIILGRGNERHLIEFDVYVNKQLISHYRSDGLIISTPTGSTAYALSAGGPIMHPTLNAIVLVPMFSHSLSSRPLVIDGESHIELYISPFNEYETRVSCDGHESHMVKPGIMVSIKKHYKQLRLLHPLDYHYYDTLRSKLGWESRYKG